MKAEHHCLRSSALAGSSSAIPAGTAGNANVRASELSIRSPHAHLARVAKLFAIGHLYCEHKPIRRWQDRFLFRRLRYSRGTQETDENTGEHAAPKHRMQCFGSRRHSWFRVRLDVSTRKSSHGTAVLIVSRGSPLAPIAFGRSSMREGEAPGILRF